MIKKNNLNFNINKDENIYNDFIYCWSEMGLRPSKTTIFKNYNKEFIEYFNDKKNSEISVQEDIIPLDEDRLINQRFFLKLENNIWVTFANFDVESEESFVGEVCFFYDYKLNNQVRNIIENLDQFELLEDSQETSKSTTFSRVVYNQSGLDIEPMVCKEIDFENIEYYYNDESLKQINKLSKKIKKSNQGLSIIYGEKGVGKTSVIPYLQKKVKNKPFIYLPTNLFETTINNPEFKTFLKKHKNSVIILDDAELFFSETFYVKSNIFTTNLLQLVDGFDSHELGLNLILLLNCEKENDIDSYVLSSNNLIDVVKIESLTKNKSNQLIKFLGKKQKIKSSTKLNDILKDKNPFFMENDLGFD